MSPRRRRQRQARNTLDRLDFHPQCEAGPDSRIVITGDQCHHQADWLIYPIHCGEHTCTASGVLCTEHTMCFSNAVIEIDDSVGGLELCCGHQLGQEHIIHVERINA